MTISREDLEAGSIDLTDVAEAGTGHTPSPGELLRSEWLEPLGISAYRLAKDIDVPANRITGILNGTRAISADTALRLARYFGTDPQSWLNLQARYDLERARVELASRLDAIRPHAA
ncbi:MAG TPA: HigA family addiction module antitoxin [Azospirillaceae bacterium]|nr:HigA family addiction module antitoxin [Azospirillaceae bacterium]